MTILKAKRESSQIVAQAWLEKLVDANVIDRPSWVIKEACWTTQIAYNVAHYVHILRSAAETISSYYHQNLIMRTRLIGKPFVLDENMSNWRHLLILVLTLEEEYGQFEKFEQLLKE